LLRFFIIFFSMGKISGFVLSMENFGIRFRKQHTHIKKDIKD